MAEEYLEDAVLFEDCEAIHETEKAILVKGPEFARPVWIPRSDTVLHADSEVWKKYCDGKLIVYRWWAEKKGLV